MARERHYSYVVHRRKVIIALALLLSSVAGFIWFLVGESLDDAEKWVSIAGVATSVCLGAAGVALAWLTWRQARGADPSPRVRASGAGSTAIGGGNNGKIDARVSGTRARPAAAAPEPGGVVASGDGATAIGGDNRGDIRTEVTDRRRGRRS